jgi:hypothetical protein
MQKLVQKHFLTRDWGRSGRGAELEQKTHWKSALTFLAALVWLTAAPGRAAEAFQPRAVPLVTTDPYFSIWSFADHLTDDVTRHSTGKPQSLESMIRIDGAVYRIMGKPVEEEALPQVGLAVFPTRTVYEFEGAAFTSGLCSSRPSCPTTWTSIPARSPILFGKSMPWTVARTRLPSTTPTLRSSW